MSNEMLLGSITTEPMLDPSTGELSPLKYLEGKPRQYRFNASTGQVKDNGKDPITEPSENFSFLPLAVRIFHDELFGQEPKIWAEMFFINQLAQVCAIMVHGFSVQEFRSLEAELFYSDVMIDNVILTLRPIQKTSKKLGEDGKQKSFFVAKWSFKKAKKEVVAVHKEAAKDLKLFRADTYRQPQTMLSLNYHEPKPQELPEGFLTKTEIEGELLKLKQDIDKTIFKNKAAKPKKEKP
jgi:hypothetical protein